VRVGLSELWDIYPMGHYIAVTKASLKSEYKWRQMNQLCQVGKGITESEEKDLKWL
jgi:hypothetical protein